MAIMRYVTVIAALVAVAACSTAPQHSRPAASHRAAPPVRTAPVLRLPPGVTLSAQARDLPAGPFALTITSCGPYTAAQRNALGTTARGGLTFRYSGTSGKPAEGAPILDVEFLDGSTVAGENVNGAPADVSRGQSASAGVDALTQSGGNLAFTGCELMDYRVITPSGGQPGSYAP